MSSSTPAGEPPAPLRIPTQHHTSTPIHPGDAPARVRSLHLSTPDQGGHPAALRTAGWDVHWERAWMAELPRHVRPHHADRQHADRQHADRQHGSAEANPQPVPGRVCRADRGSCEVLLLDEADPVPTLTAHRVPWGARLAAVAATDPTAAPVAGDWVVVATPTGTAGQAPPRTVEAVLPRRTAVLRAQVAKGSSYGQVLAANADVVAVVEGLDPDPDAGRVERLLTLAWASGARPVVLLTKADLVPDPALLVEEVSLLAPGADVHAVSATTGAGLQPLRELLASGATVALVGASGVGKSTLLNALLGGPDGPAEVMRTAALRADGKGRHTTVTRELHLAAGGGALLDTPGLRTIGLLGAETLDDVFTEISDLAAGCRFRDCAHSTEPGCAVLAAVASGQLPDRRLASYRKLLREVEYQASRTDARVRAARAGRWRAVQKQARRRANRP